MQQFIDAKIQQCISDEISRYNFVTCVSYKFGIVL